MNDKLLPKIHNAIFSPLRSWAEQSSGNWNILLGIGFLLLIVSIIFAYVFYKKIGTEDERTNTIFLKSSFFMLLTVIFCDMVFPKEYMWNIFFLFKYGFAILAGGLFMAIQYRRDFT
ncbi:DUF2178 domain-containing protein [Halobacillus salinus]|uniref:DUF2178 domain-containing protein n=1 Tax=Halobacillus salinus TaxID=192814 RepID=A0A4Z0GV47_9BACI|nr:DUF2178 domain-containing protein [Halobacillus salinus]TGB01097.1 DUF2178 domain-containing protein [Halobacillus salinus]